MRRKCEILFVGESAFKIHRHYKGFACYETAYVSGNLNPFINAMEKEEVKVTYIRNEEVALNFPLALEELDRFDCIVISDAPADSFLLHPQTLAGERLPNRFKLMEEYVSKGGGLVMVGGWMTFAGFQAKARYFLTPLAELLPVQIYTFDDRMEIPEGVYPVVQKKEHPILENIPANWPFFLGYNKTSYRKGDILMTINDDPLLVADTFGEGRVAVFMSDILPHWGPKEFVSWEYYSIFWSQLFKWASSRHMK